MILECVFVIVLVSSLFQPVDNFVEASVNLTKSNIDSDSFDIMENPSSGGSPEELEYKKGETFSLSFKSFASMGYKWNITNDYNTTIIRNIDRVFQVADPNVIGGPTLEIFTFEALNTGSTLLKFSNARGAQENPEEVRVYLIKVVE